MSIMLGHGDQAVALAKALGINTKMMAGFTLRCAVGEAVTITCEYYQDDLDVNPDAIKTAIKDYQLVTVAGGAPIIPQPEPERR